MLETEIIVSTLFIFGGLLIVAYSIFVTVRFLFSKLAYEDALKLKHDLLVLARMISDGAVQDAEAQAREIKLEATLVAKKRPLYFGLVTCLASLVRILCRWRLPMKTFQAAEEGIIHIANALPDTYSDSVETVAPILRFRNELYRSVIESIKLSSVTPKVNTNELLRKLEGSRVRFSFMYGNLDSQLADALSYLNELCHISNLQQIGGGGGLQLLSIVTLRNICHFLQIRVAHNRLVPNMLKYGLRRQIAEFSRLLNLYKEKKYDDLCQSGFLFPYSKGELLHEFSILHEEFLEPKHA